MNYAVARQKLKQAEDVSDLTSNTEKEEYLKKSRQIRAAKIMDDTSSNDELSDELSDEFLNELPKMPNMTEINKQKIVENAQKDFNYSQNVNRKYTKKIQDRVKNRTAPYSRCISETGKKDDSQLQKHKNIKIFDSDLNCMAVYDCNWDLQGPQCTENLLNVEQRDEVSDDVSVPISTNNTAASRASSKKLNYESNSQYTEKNLNAEQCDDEIDSGPMSANNTAVPSLNLSYDPKSDNFQRFVVRKLIDLELKVNSNSRKLKMICENQKLILEKLSNCQGGFETEEREEIDIFQDFPLKEQQNLEVMETKLQNDISYRNQMIKQLAHATCQNMKTSCLRLMRLILSNELATKYSWYGAKKKQNFSKLHLCKLIMSVIRKSHADATDEQISAPIKIWLAHAKERMERGHNTGRTETVTDQCNT